VIRRSLLAGVALALLLGCGGAGRPVSLFVPTPIPENRAVVVIGQDGGQSVLASVSPVGGDLRRHALLEPNTTVLDVNPDGTAVLLVRDLPEGRGAGLYLLRLVGSGDLLTRLSDRTLDNVLSARFSPDGNRISGIAIINGRSFRVRSRTEGGDFEASSTTTLTADYLTNDEFVAVISDLESSYPDFDLVLQSDGSQPKIVGVQRLPVSIDGMPGRAVVSGESGSDDVGLQRLYAWTFTDNKPVVITSGEHRDLEPRLSPDGQRVYFVRAGIGLMAVPFSGGPEATLLAGPNVLYTVAGR